MTSKKKLLIVGAGFGGLAAAREIGRREEIDFTVIDRRNYHLFQPLLYQVAMAGLSPADIASPIRHLLAGQKNTRCLLGEISRIDADRRVAVADFGEVEYDWLILACGSQHSYFGHEEWESRAPGLKTLEQATEVRRRVLTSFELAERETDPEKARRLLTFVVVGGGATGVELAGSLAELSRFALSRDFRRIDPRNARVILIEAGSRVLAAFDPSLSARAKKDLEEIGVAVWLNTNVTDIDEDGVQCGSDRLSAATVVWAAGVKPSPLSQGIGAALDRSGRAVVSPDLSLAEHPEIFVIGDQASFIGAEGKPLPGLAPVAMQQGRHAARNVLADLHGGARSNFKYLDKGQMATIGRRKGVLQTGSFKMSGVLAWYAWLVIHIFYLIGFRNRALVLFQWAWAYFSYARGAQLIVNKEWRSTR